MAYKNKSTVKPSLVFNTKASNSKTASAVNTNNDKNATSANNNTDNNENAGKDANIKDDKL